MKYELFSVATYLASSQRSPALVLASIRLRFMKEVYENYVCTPRVDETLTYDEVHAHATVFLQRSSCNAAIFRVANKKFSTQRTIVLLTGDGNNNEGRSCFKDVVQAAMMNGG